MSNKNKRPKVGLEANPKNLNKKTKNLQQKESTVPVTKIPFIFVGSAEDLVEFQDRLDP